MAISRFYDKTATSQREDYVSGSTVKKTFVSKLSSFPCHVQPQDASLVSTLPGSFGKNWILFCAVADVQEGDKIVVNGTDEYRVTGIETYNIGPDPHLEITMRAFKE